MFNFNPYDNRVAIENLESSAKMTNDARNTLRYKQYKTPRENEVYRFTQRMVEDFDSVLIHAHSDDEINVHLRVR